MHDPRVQKGNFWSGLVRYRFQLAGMSAVLLAASLLIYSNSKPRRIAYHLGRLQALKKESKKLEKDTGARRIPVTISDYTHLSTILWQIRGRHSFAEDWQRELDVLVNLGCFQRKEMQLTNREAPLDPSKVQMDPQVRKAFFGGLNSPWFVRMDTQRPHWIQVTGTNLDTFVLIVSRWDEQAKR